MMMVEDKNYDINYYDKFADNELSQIALSWTWKFDSCLHMYIFLLGGVCRCFFASNFFGCIFV